MCSLVVGERVVSRSYDGLLEVEYALFDPDDVIVTAQLGFGAREQGYLTTAGSARERMRALGINPVLAGDTFAAFRSAHLRSLARAPFVVQVLDQLTAFEAFEGGSFSSETRTYGGTWLDLRALAQACPLSNAGLVLQALHLLLVVDEVPEDAPVRLLTAEATATRRPGERTWSKSRFESAPRLPWVLRAMRVPPPPPPLLSASDEEELRTDLVSDLRARATASANARVRLRSLAAQVSRPQETPAYGSPPIDSIETATAALRHTPQPRAKAPALEPLVPEVLPLFEELRRHTDLLKGEAHLRDVAKFLSAMSGKSDSVPELAILAARAWLAAGEMGHARHVAKQLVANLATPDHVRLTALEILKSTAPTNESGQPPPVAMIEPVPIVVLSSEPDRAAPAGASLPPFAEEPRPLIVEVMPAVAVTPFPRAAATARPHDEPTLSPPVERRATTFRLGRSEIVESLPLPAGVTEESFAEGDAPATPSQMRVAMTRQARALGRDYRLWYGTTLKTNAMAIEAMQRHLRRRFGDGGGDAKTEKRLEVELTRHGALLSEILARILGGEWVDVSGDEPGRWAMTLGSSMRVWPIGRVYRFFRQGHRDADLVAFYLDLERAQLGDAK
jgi:hypothetical protein